MPGLGLGVKIPIAKLSDVQVPVLSAVEVGNVADNKIVLTYLEALDETSVAATGDYSVAGTDETVSSVAVSGVTVILTMSGNIFDFQTILLDYTAGANPIRDLAENNAANLVNQAVTNNSSTSHPAILDSANTLAFFKNEIAYITKDGSDFVSQWSDISGEDNHLLQAIGTNQPLWQSTGVLFDGIDNFMKCIGFTYEQPEQIYIVFKHITWSNNDVVFDGEDGDNRGTFLHTTSTPRLSIYAGDNIVAENSNLPLNTFGIARVLFNGASSKIQINETTVTTGDAGTDDMNGFTLGSLYNGINLWMNMEVKEIILRNIADTAPNEQIIYDYLANKYSI